MEDAEECDQDKKFYQFSGVLYKVRRRILEVSSSAYCSISKGEEVLMDHKVRGKLSRIEAPSNNCLDSLPMSGEALFIYSNGQS